LENFVKSSTIIVVVLTLLLAACTDWDDPKTARAQRAAAAKGDIVIGAVWPWSGVMEGGMWQGIELAVEEINAEGGVLNRKLRIIKEDDESSLAKGRLIAQRFSENPDMVAVIGHLYSYIAAPASSIYQSAGLVYLTPGATNYPLNTQGYGLFFRSIPSNRSLGKRMAEHMAAQGYRRVAIYYVKDKNSQNMANYFEQRARELGLNVVDRRSFMQGNQDFSYTIRNWQELYSFDALFLSASMPEAGQFITQARKLGLSVPIVGDDGADTPELIKFAGAAAEGVAVPDIFVHDDNWPAYRHFNEMFTKKYRRVPEAGSALGYDSVHLLAQAIRRANSTVPEQIAKALHATHQWPGATGEFTFDEMGDIPDKNIGVKVVRGGKFVTVR
jgi:branched-chain amino acid transport system substrate-binding protein